jgi:phospholipid/cholesterol/gamma-HCH transport system substrate-binding protein
MSKSRLEWKVGLFVLMGLALLAVLLIQFSKGTTFFRKTYTILLRASDVGGLKTKAGVLMAGVQVGTVSDIRLGPEGTNVTIALRIFGDYEIHKDVNFVIEASGFLGDQYVAIMPTVNQADVFRDGDTAQATAPFNFQQVARDAWIFLQRFGDTAKELNEAIADVRRRVLNEATLTNMAAAVASIRAASDRAVQTVDRIDALVSTNGPSLGLSGSNLVFFSEQLNAFAANLGLMLATNSVGINSSVKNIESATEVMTNVLADLHAGRGLAGNLLKNEQLADSVSQIANNLSITSSNLNRLGLWHILWSHKPPRTNAPAATTAERPLTTPKDTP